MQSVRLALYTTVYPGVEKYLSAWYESVSKQTDREFDIWIGIDGLEISDVLRSLAAELPITWVVAAERDTPAQIRQKAIASMVRDYPAVIFVDSDDLLEPTRVEAARFALEKNDVSGCSMRLIDENGTDLGIVFAPPMVEDIGELLPRNNLFGLSNTAYRSEILAQCCPIPAECALVDWFLVTSAWTLGARLGFDRTARMAYRQHSSNIARVLPPFAAQQVILSTQRVLSHYDLVLAKVSELQPQHRRELEAGRNRVSLFYSSVSACPDILHQYVRALNQLPPNHLWWACVAHPQLEYLWKKSTCKAD